MPGGMPTPRDRRVRLTVVAKTVLFALAGTLAWASWIAAEAQVRAARSLPSGALWPQRSVAGAGALADPRQGPDLARLHLRVSALDPEALHDLALARPSQDRARSDGLQLAERVTRRHAPTEIQLLVQASGDQDYAALLRHADHLLAVPTGLEQGLLDSLALGLSDPALRTALRPYHQHRWFGSFLAVSLRKADPRDVLTLVKDSPASTALPAALVVALQESLVTAGLWQEARALAIARGGVAPTAIDSFALPGNAPALAGWPMTWRIADEGVDLSVDWRGPGVAFAIAGGTTVPIMERFTALAPGDYELSHAMTLIDARDLAAWWDLSCSGAGGTAHAFAQRIAVSDRQERYRLTIPQGCSVQHWQLRALGEDGQRPILFELEKLDLRPSERHSDMQ